MAVKIRNVVFLGFDAVNFDIHTSVSHEIAASTFKLEEVL
jgi:hypothetical protein